MHLMKSDASYQSNIEGKVILQLDPLNVGPYTQIIFTSWKSIRNWGRAYDKFIGALGTEQGGLANEWIMTIAVNFVLVVT